ncbi:MAG: alternative ribosome rescue aminoacyl-tRNA hydrolase ArfB [Anaerolineae bacterium]|jgi:ribosome-associated protein
MDEEALHIGNGVTIPRSELDFRYSRSSGPGGQHAQKSSTRVELLFDVASSPSLDANQQARVMKRLAGYIDAEGVLHLVSQSERSQYRNREEVVERFEALMRQALKRRKRRKPTKPSAASKERRLQRKKRRSQKKKRRGRVRPDDW